MVQKMYRKVSIYLDAKEYEINNLFDLFNLNKAIKLR